MVEELIQTFSRSLQDVPLVSQRLSSICTEEGRRARILWSMNSLQGIIEALGAMAKDIEENGKPESSVLPYWKCQPYIRANSGVKRTLDEVKEDEERHKEVIKMRKMRKAMKKEKVRARRVPGEKPVVARERANNKLNPHMASTPGFELGPQWWEASALTTAPSLSPQMMYTYCIMNCFVQKGRGISVQSVKLIPR
ncbi:unnamed protein product [Porites lobata]|uniref:Uncharacterized protein n=1 Tax=Porites lobata TaxID=104759 RepID=A0ABN8R3Z4_9CNID|nr:unnamed protein product [Porites lobata]